MKMFESVALAYDQWSMDVGLAIRGALELFRLNVYPHFCVQKRNAVDFLGGKIPDSKYVVLCTHGLGEEGNPAVPEQPADEMRMGFHVVDQIDGKWDKIEFALTPANIERFVKLEGRTVIALGCGNGREPLARAFLRAGCRSYIGAVRPIDQDSTVLFAISFFYHLLREDRDPSLQCSQKEAVRRSASIDAETGFFRYYGLNDTS